MRMIALVGVLGLAIGSLPSQGVGPTRQKLPWVLEGRNVVTVDPPAAILAAAKKYDDLSNDILKGVVFDLNSDGVDDYILQGRPASCGTGGCPYVVFDGAAAKPIGVLWGNPVIVRAQSSRRFPDIDAYSHASATSGSYTSYTFDGSRYVEQSTRVLRGAAVKELFAMLNKIPRWQPAKVP